MGQMPRFFKVQSSECKVQLLSAPTARTAFPLSSRAFLFVIAREHCDRGDPVDNKVARIRVRTLLTGLLRCAAHDKYDEIHITWTPVSSHAMTKRKQQDNTKHPYMIFLLQDFVQTNRINTKHMPKINHRLD